MPDGLGRCPRSTRSGRCCRREPSCTSSSAGSRVAVQQGPCRHHEPRGAEPALQRGAVARLALRGEAPGSPGRRGPAPRWSRTSWPSASTASTMQESTALPSRITVQAPQAPSPQASLRPVNPRRSRRTWPREVPDSRSRPRNRSWSRPLTRKRMPRPAAGAPGSHRGPRRPLHHRRALPADFARSPPAASSHTACRGPRAGRLLQRSDPRPAPRAHSPARPAARVETAPRTLDPPSTGPTAAPSTAT